jgi:alcohol dehydrogenase class IV
VDGGSADVGQVRLGAPGLVGVIDRFVFRTAGRVVFGRGARGAIGEAVAPWGRALLVIGGRSLAARGELERLRAQFASAGVEVATFSVAGEPDVAAADRGAAMAIAFEARAVVAVGGGSVLDAGKAIAALATNGGSAVDYLEDLPTGGGRTLEAAPLPLVAVPTTAGTGSEVTRNAVLRVPDASLKRSMRDDRMIAAVAIVDPELAAGAPSDVAVPAALDALTHLIEAYVSRGAQPTTNVLALEGARLAVRGLNALAANGAPGGANDAWDDLALASLWGGIALANAGLGAVHGLAAPLGGRCAIPHGAACAALLVPTIRANVAAMRARAPGAAALTRYADLASALTGRPDPDHLAATLDGLRVRLGARSLSSYGATVDDVSPIVAAARGGSMKHNPVALTDAELDAVMRSAGGF